jgi:flagellar biosynthesis/type III secretory pathway M-ring protein FliF/YscJ
MTILFCAIVAICFAALVFAVFFGKPSKDEPLVKVQDESPVTTKLESYEEFWHK